MRSQAAPAQKLHPAPILIPRSDPLEILIEQLEYLMAYHSNAPHINCSRCRALNTVRIALLEPFETRTFEE